MLRCVALGLLVRGKSGQCGDYSSTTTLSQPTAVSSDHCIVGQLGVGQRSLQYLHRIDTIHTADYQQPARYMNCLFRPPTHTLHNNTQHIHDTFQVHSVRHTVRLSSLFSLSPPCLAFPFSSPLSSPSLSPCHMLRLTTCCPSLSTPAIPPHHQFCPISPASRSKCGISTAGPTAIPPLPAHPGSTS